MEKYIFEREHKVRIYQKDLMDAKVLFRDTINMSDEGGIGTMGNKP